MVTSERAEGGAPLLQALDLVTTFVDGFDPDRWSGADAAGLVRILGRIERVVGAGLALAARRVASTNGWKAEGHASPAEWLASEAGSSIGSAQTTLTTGERLESCPTAEQAWRRGDLSASQVALVASGTAMDPGAEARLVRDARQGSFDQLRRSTRAVRAAARSVHPVDTAAIHRSRYLRHWTAEDGALEGRFRLVPDKGAVLLSALEQIDRQVFEEHRRAGDREAPDAYRADSLVALAQAAIAPGRAAGGSAEVGPSAVIRVRVDHSALVRGHLEPGETCEIEGIGPVPLEVVRRAAGDAVLRAVLTDGDRVIDVRHAGRTLPRRLREALDERDRACVVPGCGRRRSLEYHHLEAYHIGGVASLDNMARVCVHHHDQITYDGAALVGVPPDLRWVPAGQDARPADGPGGTGPPAPDRRPPTAPGGADPPTRSDTDPEQAGFSP